jgi:hypothetical protein
VSQISWGAKAPLAPDNRPAKYAKRREEKIQNETSFRTSRSLFASFSVFRGLLSRRQILPPYKLALCQVTN